MYIEQVTEFTDRYGDANEDIAHIMRDIAEEILRAGDIFRPVFMFFDDNKKKIATLTLRNAETKADRNVAFLEACMLFPILDSEAAYFCLDDYVSTKADVSPLDDPDRKEALITTSIISRGAKVIMMPYERDDEGNFDNWTMTHISGNDSAYEMDEELIALVSHFIHQDIRASNHNEFFDILRSRGHELIIEDAFNPMEEYPI